MVEKEIKERLTALIEKIGNTANSQLDWGMEEIRRYEVSNILVDIREELKKLRDSI